MIRFHQVSKAYRGGHQALQKVNFHLLKGDMAFLTGHSGAGKSTLLKLLCAIERPTDGQILFNGHDIAKINSKDVPFLRRNIGAIFQDHKLLMDRSVFDNVALPLCIGQASKIDIKKRVPAALDKVGLLDKLNCLPIQLSGGEQQRVGIARAVVNRPQVLLADEPTGNLDAELSQQIMKLFRQFNQVGVTVLMATHDTSLLNNYDMRHFDLNRGHFSEVGRRG
ncbi:cell division ATP-binding protein FtsE [Candidatus Enterovibrio escicola]|uniref:Cell division ATP-binding protein FtsE n=1 Tax=Candidatus Enterovibrio escicola TaxID=1927127 RepID=A0A2A5T533_9GAMM|nr:cell division ATP-binding protein FtsE [Candidatus Enterovibrio escacola]PCS23263.1 Cell division transporter, ATP-binding protein FtsE [Candidatus Enterovibrio escacola]